MKKYREENKIKIKKINKSYRLKNANKIKAYRKINKNKHHKYMKKWRAKNKKKHKEYDKKYKLLHPEIRKAHYKSRDIKIPNGYICIDCKKRRATEKHHKDYSKPKEVDFLCKRCHTRRHHDI